MTFISDVPGLATLRETTQRLEAGLRTANTQLKIDLAAKEDAKKQRSYIDDLEDKVMAATAVAAAAAGTPEQAKAMLSKARARAMQAAADGADTASLDAMVRQMEQLAKIAERNNDREKHGGKDASAAAIPTLVTLGKS